MNLNGAHCGPTHVSILLLEWRNRFPKHIICTWIPCKHSQWHALNPDTPEFNCINEIWVIGDNRLNFTNATMEQLHQGMAIGMLQAWQTPTAVARQLGCHFSTVARLSQHYQITGSMNNRPYTSRPRVTTAAQDRYIRVTHLRNCMMPATHTCHHLRVTTAAQDRYIRVTHLRNRMMPATHTIPPGAWPMWSSVHRYCLLPSEGSRTP